MEVSIRIVVAGNQPIVRAGIVTVLRKERTFMVIAETEDGLQTLELVQRAQPDVLILAAYLPYLSGIGVASVLAANLHPPRMLMYSSEMDVAVILASLQAGATGYMSLAIGIEELLTGVKDVLFGRQTLLGLERLLPQEAPPLSLQEIAVLQQVAQGLTTKEVAHLLGISRRTVTTHLSHVFEKLGVHNRVALVERARSLGYLSADSVSALPTTSKDSSLHVLHLG
jgi:DNA-binding NarL/FixJ family response regulator